MYVMFFFNIWSKCWISPFSILPKGSAWRGLKMCSFFASDQSSTWPAQSPNHDCHRNPYEGLWTLNISSAKKSIHWWPKLSQTNPCFFNENSSQPPEVLEGFFSNCRTSFQTSPDHQSSLFFAINFQALDSYIMCFCIPAIGGSLCSVWGTQPKNGCSACSRQPQRVEAEATSLTTYRQNIGILDVGGKPRGKKNSQGEVEVDVILIW